MWLHESFIRKYILKYNIHINIIIQRHIYLSLFKKLPSYIISIPRFFLIFSILSEMVIWIMGISSGKGFLSNQFINHVSIWVAYELLLV